MGEGSEVNKWIGRLTALGDDAPPKPPVEETVKTDRTHITSVLAVPPAKGFAVPVETASPADANKCEDCTNRLRWGTCAKPDQAGLIREGVGFGITWADAPHSGRCDAYSSRLVVTNQPSVRRYKLSPSELDLAHREPWSAKVITRYLFRVARLRERGMSDLDAEDLAERMHLRACLDDDRRMCVECTSLTDDGRCLAAAQGRLAGTHRMLTPVIAILQRCEGFVAISGLR